MAQKNQSNGNAFLGCLLFFANIVGLSVLALFLIGLRSEYPGNALGGWHLLLLIPIYLFLPWLLMANGVFLILFRKYKLGGLWRIIGLSSLVLISLSWYTLWYYAHHEEFANDRYMQTESKISQEYAINLMNDCKVTGVQDVGDERIQLLLEHDYNAYVGTPSYDSAVVIGGDFAILQDAFNKASAKCSNLDIEQANHNENISREDAIRLIDGCMATGVIRNGLTKRVELPLKPAAGYRTAYAAESDFETLLDAYPSKKCIQ